MERKLYSSLYRVLMAITRVMLNGNVAVAKVNIGMAATALIRRWDVGPEKVRIWD